MADYAEPLKRAIYRFRRVTLFMCRSCGRSPWNGAWSA